jgi:gamma-glutamylcyclotransferase (GGCT)/AIG2-like uncharacterized protein YtfP
MKLETNQRLFVYGTLRSGSKNEFFDLLKENSKPIGKGMLNARLYDLGAYPGAKPSKNKGEVTLGEVYEVDQNKWNEVIKRLDEYEGFDVNDPNNSEYVRKRTKIKMGPKSISAWTYLYNRPLRGKRPIWTGDYSVHKMEK